MIQSISRYRIIKKIGEGGMGEVYKAQDMSLDRSVALKILPAHLVADADRVRRFVQEAKSASALNHPHIITIYEIGQARVDDNGEALSESDPQIIYGKPTSDASIPPASANLIHYIAMEFVDGQTLHAKIHRERTDLKKMLEYLAQAADGLAKAHAAGIVHRDLKPENVMITEDGYAKILDFGLAKLIESKDTSSGDAPSDPEEVATAMMDQTRPGMVMGTIGYMSPEQVQGKAVDPRSDIFSFGCILYEAAAGRKPFSGDSIIDSLHKIVYSQAPPLKELNPNAPAELQRIIRKSLAKDPAERYQSIRDMAIDLRELLKEYDSQPTVSGAFPQAALSGSYAQTPSTDSTPSLAATNPPEASLAGAGTSISSAPSTGALPAEKRGVAGKWIALAAGLLVVVAAIAFAVYRSSQPTFEIPVEQFTLKNGLRVVLSEDHSAPTYSIVMTYNVGSRDERQGQTGYAHLFEHMMFQGSEKVGKGEHFILIENNGGAMDGGTTPDYTQYWQTLPTNQLELGLFLESDRMRSLAINQANLDNQRAAVLEERRTRIDNQPYGKTSETIFNMAYENFAYKHHPYGTDEDLRAAKIEDLNEFFKTYYAPNNAVLTLVGDFKRDQAEAAIRKYFEEIPAQPSPPVVDLSEPPQQGERRKTVEDTFAQTPRIDIVARVSPGNTDEWYALNVLGQVLVGGQSSRLYQQLVKEKEVAVSVDAQAYELVGPSLAWISIVARPGKDFAQIERLIYSEMEQIKNNPPSDQEIEKALIQIRRQRAFYLQSTRNRAALLGQYAVAYNDPELINTAWDKFRRVTKQDLQRAIESYLDGNNRIVVTTVPKPGGAITLRTSALDAAQDSKTPPASKVERKNNAPVSREILQFKSPKVIEETLDNGLTVLILEDQRLPTVYTSFSISGVGSVYEPPEMPGLANTTARMLREGTRNYTSKQIAEEMEQRGAILNTYSDFGSIAAVVDASGVSDTFDEWFAMTCEVLLNPTFPVDELNILKQRLKVDLQQQRASSSFLANERFNRAVFGQHPAAVVAPTLESINAITPELLARWHRDRYAPQNTVLGIAGNVRASDLVPKLKKLLGGWQRTEGKDLTVPGSTAATTRSIHLVDRPNSVQTILALGNIAVTRQDPDYIPLVVLDRLLGRGPASRLFINLREEKGYAYRAFSQFAAFKYAGPWVASGDVRTEVTEPALVEFLKEITRIGEEKVPEDELEERKRAVAANFALSLEQPARSLIYAITREVYGFSTDYWDTYPGKIMGVGADEVQRVARKYLNPAAIQIVAVGDASRIKSALEKYGPVQVYNTEGKQ